jgi:hypothetical protein
MLLDQPYTKNTLKKEDTFKKLHISVFIFGLGYISTWFWFWLVPAQHWFQQVLREFFKFSTLTSGL